MLLHNDEGISEGLKGRKGPSMSHGDNKVKQNYRPDLGWSGSFKKVGRANVFGRTVVAGATALEVCFIDSNTTSLNIVTKKFA